MTNAPQSMTKGEFAVFVKRSPGRVSQWIAAGQISAGAMDGQGRTAKIIVSRALADLAANLDPGQRHGLNAILAGGSIPRLAETGGAFTATASPSAGPSEGVAPHNAERTPGTADGDQSKLPPAAPGLSFYSGDATADAIALEKLEQARMQTARMRRDERAADGTYMRADDARAAMGKAASMVLSAVEGGLSAAADAIAARFENAPPRDVQHILTEWLRSVRESSAKSYGDMSAAEGVLLAETEDEA